MKQKLSALSQTMQRSFVTLAFIAYGCMLFTYGQIIYQISAMGVNLATYLSVTVWASVVPLLFFGIGWLFAARKQSTRQRLFQVVVYTLLATLLQSVLSSLTLIVTNEILLYEYNQFVQSIIPLALALIAYAGVLLYNKKREGVTEGISDTIEWIYAGLGIGLFAVQACMIGARILNQLPFNSNLSGSYPTLIQSIVLPLLLFAIAYFWVAKHPMQRTRLFRSTLFATGGFMIFTSLSAFTQFIVSTMFQNVFTIAPWAFLAYLGGTALLALIIYIVWLMVLQRQSRT